MSKLYTCSARVGLLSFLLCNKHLKEVHNASTGFFFFFFFFFADGDRGLPIWIKIDQSPI